MSNVTDLAERVINAGLVPETLAAIDLLQSTDDAGRAAIAKAAGIMASRTVDPATGEITPTGIGQAEPATPKVLPRRNSISAEAIIPTEAREVLEGLRGQDDVTRWAIGDLSAALVEELRGTTRIVQVDTATGEVTERARNTAADIRAAVADLAGLQPSTVRQYEAAAELYQAGPRQRFANAGLTWTYFREAMSAKDALGALEWCLTSADDFGGKIAPVRALKAKIAAERPAGPPKDAYQLAGKAKDMLGEALDCENVPEKVRAKWQKALDALLDA